VGLKEKRIQLQEGGVVNQRRPKPKGDLRFRETHLSPKVKRAGKEDYKGGVVA